MADVTLHDEGVDQAISDMRQATQQMTTALDELVRQLRPLAGSFEGASAAAWADFQRQVSQADSAMRSDFGMGANVLSQPHRSQLDGDRQGTSILGG